MAEVCMLCLERRSQYEIIENLLKELLDTLLIQLDVTVSVDPIICTGCVKRIYELFDFKTLCIYTEDALLPFFEEANGKMDRLDLWSIYSKSKLAQVSKNSTEICRLCLEMTAHSVQLETALLETSIQNVFENHLPEVSLQATKCPFICETCLKMLHCFDSFSSMCKSNIGMMKIGITNDKLRSDLVNDSDGLENQVDLNIVKSDDGRSVRRLRKPNGRGKRNTNDDSDFTRIQKSRRESTPSKRILEVHPPPVELKVPISCNTSAASHNNHVDLAIHSIEHSRKKEHNCHICCIHASADRDIKKKHIMAHEFTYHCDVCEKLYKSVKDLRKHKMDIHDVSVSCEICSEIFSIKDDLKMHMDIHKDVHSKELLADHSRMHRMNKAYIRLHCGKRLSEKGILKNHARTHTREKPHICPYCGTGFAVKNYLKTHLRTHTGEKPHICSHCGKRFAEKTNLNSHMRIHTGEKPHICTQCGKRFVDKSNLNSHVRTHIGEKPYICLHCGKRFARKKYLNGHIRTHTGEKPYICPHCGNRFAEKNNLNSHMRTHTGEKRHICSHCGKRFAEKNNLNSHMRTHTGGKPHICPHCGKRFAVTSYLKNHVRTHTGEK